MTLATQFSGRIVMVGCGSIGQAVLPLLLRHVVPSPDRITIVTADERGRAAAERFGVEYRVQPLTRENHRAVMEPLLRPGDFLLNLSVDVESVSMVRLARELQVLYLDTVIEPWAGGYTDLSKSASERSNYGMREVALQLGRELGAGPTAVIAQGANPGLVSQLVKEALLRMAEETGLACAQPVDRAGWAVLMRDLGIKAVHIAERDTQVAAGHPKKPGEFVNTWSIDGFVGEGCQPAELGFGTHEKQLPAEGRRHGYGCDAAIYLERPGASTRVRSWTPLAGPYHGFLITHNEAISIADYYTCRDGDTVTWRPTVHYAYHPCDDAVLSVHEFAGRNWQMQPAQRLLMDEISDGIDELGVLLMGNPKGVFWYGSRLSTHEARELAPFNSATSLQVAAGVLGGVVAAIESPAMGMVEADQLDHRRVMEVARPYLGPVVGAWSDWTPLQDRGVLFPEDLDPSDPWQFKNILVR
ncbi:homospermidine synthase [Geminicoccus roseus]|uniref:homospermidine synthase n=1 Tax=Geminicoccus roseus TaxID=404900 RepID=UPI0003FE60AA|nr:saccharopine dehydrogenase NADP-binding domain-containing protein [Geminicoccus roseus]